VYVVGDFYAHVGDNDTSADAAAEMLVAVHQVAYADRLCQKSCVGYPYQPHRCKMIVCFWNQLAKLPTPLMRVGFHDCVWMGCVHIVGWAAVILRMLQQVGLVTVANQSGANSENSYGHWGQKPGFA
jgi:hypothetical protein